ncbi:MAG: hypothetical protein MUF00_00915 [Gemmatimonadaceae bacterium]|jgi:hypothetical protein|nr:hypothetical protein [Gemmatimonadaceae bacterium]
MRRRWGGVWIGVALGVASAVAAQPPPVAVLADTAAGRRMFATVCASCHSVGPPAKSAPPMRMVVMRLHAQYPDRDAFVRHVVRWAQDPDSNMSVMPRRVREHFGLMLPVPLPNGLLENVATWLWMVNPPEMGMPVPKP